MASSPWVVETFPEGSPVINEEEVLEEVGDYGFLVEILDDFMNERGKTLTGIRAALDAKDYMELQELAHSQKGSALNLRLPRLAKDEPVVSATECWGFTESLLARLKAEYMLLEETMPGLREKVEEEEGDEGDCASSQEDDA